MVLAHQINSNARRTYEGSKVAEVQAEPLDTAASLSDIIKIHLQQS